MGRRGGSVGVRKRVSLVNEYKTHHNNTIKLTGGDGFSIILKK